MTAERPPLAEGIPDRLYGRRRGHVLRPRQQRLLDLTLPRLALTDPATPFPHPVAGLWLEVGFGGGEHAHALSRANPDIGYIASEVFENGLCSLLTRLVADGEEEAGALPPNLRLWPRDARHLIAALPEGALDKLILLFPDPWPKARHAKRRFVNPTMLPAVARAVRPGGEWRIASDDPTYQAWVTQTLAAQDAFAVPPPATVRPEGWPGTRYEAKALREGRTPMYWSLIRR